MDHYNSALIIRSFMKARRHPICPHRYNYTILSYYPPAVENWFGLWAFPKMVAQLKLLRQVIKFCLSNYGYKNCQDFRLDKLEEDILLTIINSTWYQHSLHHPSYHSNCWMNTYEFKATSRAT